MGIEAREEISEDETEVETPEIGEVRVTTTTAQDLTHQPPNLGVVEEGAGGIKVNTGTTLTTALVVGTVSTTDQDTTETETEENTFLFK